MNMSCNISSEERAMPSSLKEATIANRYPSRREFFSFFVCLFFPSLSSEFFSFKNYLLLNMNEQSRDG